MANRAEVYVRNMFKKEVKVARALPGGKSDLELHVVRAKKERIPLLSPEAALVIHAPRGLDTMNAYIKVKTQLDVNVSCSRTHHHWTIRIQPNQVPPDTPLDLNVEIGDDEPDD